MAWIRPHAVLALGLLIAAAGVNAAVPVPAPAAPGMDTSSAVALTVSLKDHQTAKLFLKSYDHFYLTVFNSKGTRFDIPWDAIASVDGDAGTDLDTMRGRLTPGPSPVTVVIEARRPGEAFKQALFPGILLHGAGFRYVGDHDTFVDLASFEAFGVVLAGAGAYLEAYPNTQDSSKTVPQGMIIGGAAVFVVTWLWDLGFAPGAAQSLDDSRGLALEPAARGTGAQLAYHF